MATLQQSHMLPPACSDEPPRVRKNDEKTLIVLFMTSPFITQTRVKRGCGERKTNKHFFPMKGCGIMVSDFIDKHDGYLYLSSRTLNPEIAQSVRDFLKYGCERDGYWTGDIYFFTMN